MEARGPRRILVMPDLPMKTCTVCKRELPTLAFVKNRQSSDGLNYHCVTCQKLKNAIRREKYVNGSKY